MKYSSRSLEAYLALAGRHAFTVCCLPTPIHLKLPLEKAGLNCFCILNTLVWIFSGEFQSSDNRPILSEKNLCCVSKAKWNGNDHLLGLGCKGFLFGRELRRAKKILFHLFMFSEPAFLWKLKNKFCLSFPLPFPLSVPFRYWSGNHPNYGAAPI